MSLSRRECFECDQSRRGNMADQRHPTISISDLAKAADAAAKIAAERHKVQFEQDFHIAPGLICGRILRTVDIQVQQAQQIAAQMTERIVTGGGATAALTAVSGQQFEPACICLPHHIICGFIPDPGVVFKE
jgi:hypothetical protein